jgi:AraC-like DNA-binding protein
MSTQRNHQQFDPITYSCYTKKVRDGEQFIPDHVFSYQISGTLIMNDGDTEYTFRENTFRLTRRNSLLKFLKQPGDDGEYKNISVFLDQQTLKDLSLEYGYSGKKQLHGAPVISLHPHKLLVGYIESLRPYNELLGAENSVLRVLKMKELVILLLQINPELKDVLFDFAEPGKLDLEAFMNMNFRFNVSLERFAYLTGRSLSTFKRDFENIFFCRPGKWLQQKRLQEAYFLMKEKGIPPTEVYTAVGFEDLSHFSYAFKKMYGVAPTKLNEDCC